MTLQQLEYVVAVDKYRKYIDAAEACGVTQPTLSTLIQKLEDELDVQIFDRSAHPICPTAIGWQIIAQAKVVLYNASQLKELILTEHEQTSGDVRFGIIPTVAPYILPAFIRNINAAYSDIHLHISEMRTSFIKQQLERAELDMALLATPLEDDQLLEIPIYYEKFVAYISPSEPLYAQKEIETHHIPSKHLWVLQEGHWLRNQVLNICDQPSGHSVVYEAGSIDTLVKIVDANGGYTVIPELHIPMLSGEQKKNVRPIVNPEPVREISLVIRRDYVREKLLNVISDSIRTIIPESMVDERLKKFRIRL